jgi:hypothetical protein
MNTSGLSTQAMIVAVAAAMPTLVAAYKMRWIDALILVLSGALSVYNVNCLTAGNCTMWASIVAISFFIMTVLQVMTPSENFMDLEDEEYEDEEYEDEEYEDEEYDEEDE